MSTTKPCTALIVDHDCVNEARAQLEIESAMTISSETDVIVR
jgi:hypothetical protein